MSAAERFLLVDVSTDAPVSVPVAAVVLLCGSITRCKVVDFSVKHLPQAASEAVIATAVPSARNLLFLDLNYLHFIFKIFTETYCNLSDCNLYTVQSAGPLALKYHKRACEIPHP